MFVMDRTNVDAVLFCRKPRIRTLVIGLCLAVLVCVLVFSLHADLDINTFTFRVRKGKICRGLNNPSNENSQSSAHVYFSWNHSSTTTSNITQFIMETFHIKRVHGYGWFHANDSLSLTEDPAGPGFVLKVFYKKGTKGNSACVTGPCQKGAMFRVTPPGLGGACGRFAALEYEVYFEKEFEFALGGKLPGLWGGGVTCNGCHKDRSGCFSARLMWREEGRGEVYAYVPYEQDGGWYNWCRSYRHNNMVFCPDDFCGIEIGKTNTSGFMFESGRWHRIRQEVDVGAPRRHGRISLWLDGVLKININKIVMRLEDTFGVDGLLFSTFYGGDLPEFANHGDNYIYFRNFRITNERYDVPAAEYFS